MNIRVRTALGFASACALAASGLVDCGGKGGSRPDDSGGSAGTSSGGAGGADGAGRAGGTFAGTRSIGGAGASGPTNAAGAAGAPATGCAAPNADTFETKWMPPQATPGACTAEQITQETTLCESDSPKYDRTACRAFNVEPANATCLGCLFSAFDGDVSGPILLLPGNHWQANVGGCDALLDGDSSSTSCGAREQAAFLCEYDVCINACGSDASDQDWKACRAAATKVCGQYVSKTSCANLPKYAGCHLASFAEYVATFSDLFCGSGPPGSSSEGGAGGANGTAGAAGAGGATL